MNTLSHVRYPGSLAVATLAVTLLLHSQVSAHCDGMDGPVVTDAQIALEEEDVTPVLKWVPEHDEQEVREAFDKAMTVRDHGPEARELADRYFFETLVRLHRAYEGAPFTGIQPSGTPVSPAIARADAALEAGDVDALAREIAAAVEASIREQFAATHEAQKSKDQSVEAGREYVDEYVNFVHYVKHLHQLVTGEHRHGHGDEAHGQHDAAESPHGHEHDGTDH